MHQELVAAKITIEGNADNGNDVYIDMLLAPSYVVRAFAEFLADREDDEVVLINGKRVPFQDVSVSVGDSKKVVAAYECLKRYDIPLSSCDFFSQLVRRAQTSSWKVDSNYRLFEKWYNERTDDEDDVAE